MVNQETWSVQMVNNTTNSNLLKIAIYSGNLGDNFSISNLASDVGTNKCSRMVVIPKCH